MKIPPRYLMSDATARGACRAVALAGDEIRAMPPLPANASEEAKAVRAYEIEQILAKYGLP